MPMSPLDRKAALIRRGVRQSDIARRLGVSRAFVCDVIAGNRRSEKVEQAVAEAIGRKPAAVFATRDRAAASATAAA